MATGWAKDGAVQEQIDDTVLDAVRRARSELPEGPGDAWCADCGDAIPERRRRALPGVRTCTACQSARERVVVPSGLNRRANKDSQLR
jgi:phage/conjugal plasmid C-4 type zinc finger TraR family protein